MATSVQVPLVRLDHVLSFHRFLRRLGAPVERLMRAAGLPVEALGDPEALASAHTIYGFVERAARSEGVRDLGLRVGLATQMRELGKLGAPWGPDSSAASLHEALLASFSAAGSESQGLQLWIEPAGGAARLCYRGSLGPGHPGFEVVEQYMVGLLVAMVRQAAGPEWLPPELWLRSGQAAGLRASPLLGGARIRTRSARTAIAVPWPVLRLDLRGPHRVAVSDRRAAAEREFPRDLETSLRAALRPFLYTGAPSVVLAARLAGTSVRSLQRSLRTAGTSYSKLIEEVKLRRALELVSCEQPTLADVAAELGYSDPAHFSRAFKRWTALSPRAYRQQALELG